MTDVQTLRSYIKGAGFRIVHDPSGQMAVPASQRDALNALDALVRRAEDAERERDTLRAAMTGASSWIARLPEGRPASQATCAYVPVDVYERIESALTEPATPERQEAR